MASWNPTTWFDSGETDGDSGSRERRETRKDQAGGRGRDYVEGHEPPANEWEFGTVKKQRSRARKQEVDRRTTLPPELQRNVRNREGVMKPYDPLFLKELAGNWVAQAYIDTMAQDLATAPWKVTERDEETDVGDTEKAEAERLLEALHPEKSLRDLLEMTARNTLKLGDGAWVKHYDTSGQLREAIPVDSARMFKRVDTHGLTEGYLQASFSERAVEAEFSLGEIVWFEWSSREDHVYGFGPVEKGADVIEVLEELGEKELKDLAEGMPPGIVSVKEDEDTPMAVDAYEKVKDNWDLREGERHRAIVSMGDWEFTPLQPGYQELQFMERNKMWIQSLGATFKVNAPYAGFDFQEGNMAQNRAQSEAYKQRGFAVLLRQVQEAINQQLVWEDISEDLKFEFQDLQTVDEKETHAQFQQELAAAAKEWDNLGLDVELRDEQIEVEDGLVDAPEDEGGGPFGGAQFSIEESEIASASGVPQSQLEQSAKSLQKAIALQSETGASAVPDTPEGMEDWHELLESIAKLGGMVENRESGQVWPAEDGGCLMPPADALLVHGVNAQIVEGLLEDLDLNFAVTATVQDRTEAGKQGLTKDEVLKLDDALLAAHQEQIQPEDLSAIEKRTWTDSEAVPDYVKERIGDAIDAGAVFEDIESVPSRTVEALKDLLRENLTQPQGWSLDSVVDDMRDRWPGVSQDKLETVARTETASVLNEAREQGYEDLPSAEDEPRFYWQGPSDSRTTDACEELKDRTNPDYGGDPVPMDELKSLQEDVHDDHFPSLDFREHNIHPNERHTFIRAVGVDV